MAIRIFVAFGILSLLLWACGNSSSDTKTDSDTTVQAIVLDSAQQADLLVQNDKRNIKDTVFHTALPPVHDGDILLINSPHREAQLMHQLMGGKYNHVGMIFTRKKDGILMVVDLQDSVRVTPLTDFVDRAVDGQVCLLRVKEANKTLNEEKTTGLINAAKAYKGRPFDPVMNWDDSHMYSSELVWKIYNAIYLKLCPTRTVADFDISESEKQRLKEEYDLNVSDRDEAVSTDDIYNSEKLEIIYEK